MKKSLVGEKSKKDLKVCCMFHILYMYVCRSGRLVDIYDIYVVVVFFLVMFVYTFVSFSFLFLFFFLLFFPGSDNDACPWNLYECIGQHFTSSSPCLHYGAAHVFLSLGAMSMSCEYTVHVL